MEKVVVYSKEHCPYCKKAKALLKEKKVKFKELMADRDKKVFDEMVESQRTTFPQIFIDEKHLGGYDDLFSLESTGKLNKILGIKAPKQKKPKHYELIIVGGGPAGITAGI